MITISSFHDSHLLQAAQIFIVTTTRIGNRNDQQDRFNKNLHVHQTDSGLYDFLLTILIISFAHDFLFISLKFVKYQRKRVEKKSFMTIFFVCYTRLENKFILSQKARVELCYSFEVKLRKTILLIQ